MARPRKTRLPKAERSTGRRTAITFTAEDLTALARYVSAGVALLQTHHPVIARIKAAMTRLRLPAPRGL